MMPQRRDIALMLVLTQTLSCNLIVHTFGKSPSLRDREEQTATDARNNTKWLLARLYFWPTSRRRKIYGCTYARRQDNER